jgi:predicted small metal-binding protein
MTVAQKEALKVIACDPVCGFTVKSHDEKELVKIAMEHAKKFHPKVKMTEKEVKEMITAA